jgi:hypothetical protein
MCRFLLWFVAALACAQTPPTTWISIPTGGQSLNIGFTSCVGIETSQPYANQQLTINGTLYPVISPLRPLIEDSNATLSTCASQTVETLRSAALNNASVLINSGTPTLWNFVGHFNGLSGTDYNGLKKGTSPYAIAFAATTGQIAVTQAAAVAAGKSHMCGPYLWTHGETDFRTDHTTAATYEGYLLQLQSDVDADCKTLTGQTNRVPLFLDQMSSWTFYACTTPTVTCTGDNAAPSSPIGQWWAYRDHSDRVFLVGPKYQLDYTTTNRIHLSALGEQQLGEMHAKALYYWYTTGRFVPLVPRTITAPTGTSIAVKMWVRGNLAIDTSTVSDKGNSKGFELFDSGGSTIAFTAATTVSGDTATLTMANSATVARVCYANTGTSSAGPGTSGAAHGNIRNDTGYTAISGHVGYDWLPTFCEDVGFSFTPAQPASSKFPISQ